MKKSKIEYRGETTCMCMKKSEFIHPSRLKESKSKLNLGQLACTVV